MKDAATYLYCLVETDPSPSLARAPRGLPGTSKPRAVDAGRGLWLVCADAPLERYGEAPIERGLSDLDWVSQCAMGHEAVIESVMGAGTVVPMKLFTLFKSDQRALARLGKTRTRIDRALRRLRGCDEWGVRLRIDEQQLVKAAADRQGGGSPPPRRAELAGAPPPTGPRAATPPKSGTAFLQRKKSLRDAAVTVRKSAREQADDLHEALARAARDARRRGPEDNALGGPRLVLDAAYLVERKSSARLRSHVDRLRKDLGAGYDLDLSGPWPPYHFVADVA